MKYLQALTVVLATLMIGISAAPTNETHKREEFASNNKRELEARCSSDTGYSNLAFHQICRAGHCECGGKFGCWIYEGQGNTMCQCGPGGPYTC